MIKNLNKHNNNHCNNYNSINNVNTINKNNDSDDVQAHPRRLDAAGEDGLIEQYYQY